MKPSLFTVLLICMVSFSTAQDKKFTFGLEYSPSFSNITVNHFVNDRGYHLGHNIFLKGAINIREDFDVTIGAGFLNTREADTRDLDGWMGIETIETRLSHNYLVLPIGLSYKPGSFFINPEFGVGLNVGHPKKEAFFFTDGTFAFENPGGPSSATVYKKLSFPVFLTIGNEFKLKSGVTIMTGIKSYYSLNGLRKFWFVANNYFGFGLVTGVKF